MQIKIIVAFVGVHTRGLFLESLGNFSGLKPKFDIQIKI